MADAVENNETLAGEKINGKYRLIEPVGSGGMAVVFKAEQLALSRTVALKVLRTDRSLEVDDPAFLERFTREASLCSRLSHPNIVTIFDFGAINPPSAPEFHGGYFLAMEFLEGETLHRRLKRQTSLTLEETLRIVSEIARGLREAHRHGIVHRDLKPSNVMLVPYPEESVERVKIVNFGLVKHVEAPADEEITRQGAFLGSPRYVSPEQVVGDAVDHRADIYSLGTMFYQCLCGRVPFEGENPTQVAMARLANPAPRLRERNPDCAVPEAVEALVLKMLERDVDDRPQTVVELLGTLRAIQDTLGYEVLNTSTGEVRIADSWRPRITTASSSPPGPSSGTHPITPGNAPSEPPVAVTPPAITPLREPPAPMFTRRDAVFLVVFVATVIVLVVRPWRGDAPTPSRERPSSVAAREPPSLAPTLAVIAPVVAAPVVTTDAAVTRSPTPSPLQLVVDAGRAPRREHRSDDAGMGRSVQAAAHGPASTTAPALPAITAFSDGFLSIDTVPWTQVYERGHELGSTPLVRLRLPPGEHTLTLRNPDLGVNATSIVTIRPNDTTVVHRNFDNP